MLALKAAIKHASSCWIPYQKLKGQSDLRAQLHTSTERSDQEAFLKSGMAQRTRVDLPFELEPSGAAIAEGLSSSPENLQK